VITGTYSSVYVASPFVLWIGRLADKRKGRNGKPSGTDDTKTLAAV